MMGVGRGAEKRGFVYVLCERKLSSIYTLVLLFLDCFSFKYIGSKI